MLDAVIYTRQGCHLCDEAEAKLRRVARDFPMTIRKVDVDANPALRELYDYRVPVVEVDGRIVDEGAVTEYRLRQSLKPN